MLKMLPFIRFLYPKKNINNTFLSFTFHIKMIVHTADKDQIKYFTQN